MRIVPSVFAGVAAIVGGQAGGRLAPWRSPPTDAAGHGLQASEPDISSDGEQSDRIGFWVETLSHGIGSGEVGWRGL